MKYFEELINEIKEEAKTQYLEGNVRWDCYDHYHGLSKPVVEDLDFIVKAMKAHFGEDISDEKYIEIFDLLIEEADEVYKELNEQELKDQDDREVFSKDSMNVSYDDIAKEISNDGSDLINQEDQNKDLDL